MLFRWSQLHYYYTDKMHTCRQGKANNIPPATANDKQLLDQAWIHERLAKADGELKQALRRSKKEAFAKFEKKIEHAYALNSELARLLCMQGHTAVTSATYRRSWHALIKSQSNST